MIILVCVSLLFDLKLGKMKWRVFPFGYVVRFAEKLSLTPHFNRNGRFLMVY